MTTTLEKPAAPERGALPGARILHRVLWLLVVAVAGGFVYSHALLASDGGGLGGVDSDGHYLDAAGNPTTTAPEQITAVMHANPAIDVLLGVIVFTALILVLRIARDDGTATRILTVAMIVVATVAGCAIIAGYTWFLATPLDYWTAPGPHYTGFPFASVTVTTQPMPTP